jgi:hypothetical protein
LQGNSYKPKETLEAMSNHIAFRKELLPVDFSKVEKLIVSNILFREVDFFILVAETKISDLFLSSMLN